MAIIQNKGVSDLPKKDDEIRTKKVLFGAIMSYIHAGGTEHDKKRLKNLHGYLKTMGINIDYDILKLEVSHARTKIAHKNALRKAEVELFANGNLKKFRYGSGFCPHCGMFKNYEKECPYCGYHEMTL